MRLLLSLQILALSFLAPQAIANTHGSPHAARHAHDSIARRAPGDVALHKRFDNSRWTFYDVGTGACGKFNVPSDFIVALNSAQYGGGYPGPECFKQIGMSYNGKYTVATIMDECPGCPYGGLDLSRGLFDFFAPESDGVIYGTWNFLDGSSNPAVTTTSSTYTPPPPTTTSTTPTWTPTTTQDQPSSSTTSSSTTSSQSSSSYSPVSSSDSSSSSSNYSPGATSGLTVPTPATVSGNGPYNILKMNQVVVTLADIVIAAEDVA